MCDPMTYQQVAQGPAAHHQHLNRSPSFFHVQKENQLFYSCVARCVLSQGGGKETASQMVAVSLEHATVYSPSGPVFSFTWTIYDMRQTYG